MEKYIDKGLTVIAALAGAWLWRKVGKGWKSLRSEFKRLQANVAGAAQTEARLTEQDQKHEVCEECYSGLLIALQVKGLLTRDELKEHGALRSKVTHKSDHEGSESET